MVWSGDRKPDAEADGKLPPVGNTVDVANATWTNTIGAPELIAVWKDPDFDPAQRAFYYVRVHRDPDAALDRLRRQALRRQDAHGSADDDAASAPTPRRSGTRRRRRSAMLTRLLREPLLHFLLLGALMFAVLRRGCSRDEGNAADADRRHAAGSSRCWQRRSPAPGNARRRRRSWTD